MKWYIGRIEKKSNKEYKRQKENIKSQTLLISVIILKFKVLKMA